MWEKWKRDFGIFPFTFKKKALKSSKNMQASTWETKPIQNITKAVVRDMLVNNVIAAIKSKWPANLSKDLVIQWDNAGLMSFQQMMSLMKHVTLMVSTSKWFSSPPKTLT